MSLRSNLSENLRRLCSTRPSINAVCRDIGINRQQFERYLTEQSTPGPRTLIRICAYFNIEEHELFAETHDASLPMEGRAYPETVAASCQRALEPLLTGPGASIKPGLYFLWLTIPKMRSRIICTTMVIRKDGDALSFRRITGMGESRRSNWARYRGDHKGIVVERIGQYFFTAINQRGTVEPSFLRLRWVPISEPILSGQAMIFTPAGASIVTAVMRPAPHGATLRQALRHSRVYQVTDPEIDDLLAQVLDQQCRETVAQLIADYELPA